MLSGSEGVAVKSSVSCTMCGNGMAIFVASLVFAGLWEDVASLGFSGIGELSLGFSVVLDSLLESARAILHKQQPVSCE